MRVDDLAPLIARKPPPTVRYRQGTVIAWDPITADNVIAVGGAIVTNLTSLNASEVAVIRPGDRVSILTLGRGVRTWFVVGRMTIPGGAESAIVQSADYDPGLTGYSVFRDGTAEFQDLTARGDLTVNTLLAGNPGAARVEITPTNLIQVFNASNVLVAEINATEVQTFGNSNSYVQLSPGSADTSNIAAVFFRPQDAGVGHSITTPGNITSSSFLNIPRLSATSPAIDGLNVASLFLFGGDPSNPLTQVQIAGDKLIIDGPGGTCLVQLDGDLTVTGSNPGKSVAENVLTGGAITATTTETLIGSITATLNSAYRYRFTADLSYQSTVANDLVTFKFRYAAGATVTNAGTLFGTRSCQCSSSASRGLPVLTGRRLPASLSGQHTVGVFLVRGLGTGTVQANASATDEAVLTLDRVT